MRMLIVDDDSSVVELFAQAAKSRGIEEIFCLFDNGIGLARKTRPSCE